MADLKRRKTALKSLKRRDTVGIILLGDEKVGKSSLIDRWISNKYSDAYKPTVEDFHTKTVICVNRRVNITIIDIAGSGQFPAMDELYISKSNCVVFVYEVGNENSVNSIKRYFDKAHHILKDRKVRYNIIGTKSDCHDPSSMRVVEDVGTGYFTQLDYLPKQYVTSAKDDQGISVAFDQIIDDYVRKYILEDKNPRTLLKEVDNEAGTRKKPCCTIV